MTSPCDWLHRLAHLRVDTDAEKGKAPHKPLLLLAILGMFEDGDAPRDGWLDLNADLVLRFQSLWPLVQQRRQNRGDIRMPFHALSNDGLWSVHEEDRSPSRSRVTSCKAHLDETLLANLCLPDFRWQVRALLLSRYFPADEQAGLAEALGITSSGQEPVVKDEPPTFLTARRLGRSAHFRTEVVSGYRFTCALTGYRLIDQDQLSIVEAAHIHAFRESLDNDPTNGLALTPTAHALFDRGLWSVNDDLRVIVKSGNAFVEHAPPGGFSLRALACQPLHFDTASRLRPDPRHFAWHRREYGF